MLKKPALLLIALLFSFVSMFAQHAVVTGVVRDEQGKRVAGAGVADAQTGIGLFTDTSGYYMLDVVSDKNITLVFQLTGFETKRQRLRLNSGQIRTLDIVLKASASTDLEGVTIRSRQKRTEVGSVRLDFEKTHYIPGMDDIGTLIKSFTGNHNELSNQYSVRGGNYDENLVYVNDFEIYRPFLVRAGQQEGLSFVNTDLVSNVDFSVGGFQAKYGDKMSSVLDVSYKRPEVFGGSASFSLLGGSLHLEGASKNQRLTYLMGARQKSDQYLLQAQPTKGVYNPSFTDIQALINYRLGNSWEIEAIGNYARNRFTYYPETMVSSFGVLNQAYQPVRFALWRHFGHAPQRGF
jgi:CarboxypepD_reg-like domain/TonB-dependent Receptor Plug Domain